MLAANSINNQPPAKVIAVQEDDHEKEMNRRFQEMESGEVKGYTLEEAADPAGRAYKASK